MANRKWCPHCEEMYESEGSWSYTSNRHEYSLCSSCGYSNNGRHGYEVQRDLLAKKLSQTLGCNGYEICGPNCEGKCYIEIVNKQIEKHKLGEERL